MLRSGVVFSRSTFDFFKRVGELHSLKIEITFFWFCVMNLSSVFCCCHTSSLPFVLSVCQDLIIRSRQLV